MYNLVSLYCFLVLCYFVFIVFLRSQYCLLSTTHSDFSLYDFLHPNYYFYRLFGRFLIYTLD